MPTFKAPIYSKVVNPKTGIAEPSYVFAINFEKVDEDLSFVADNVNELSLSSLQNCVLDQVTWWNNFINTFLTSSSKFFSKPYTVQHINKITKHTLQGQTPDTFPVNVVFVPKTIQISGGIFYVNWEYHTDPVVIDIPVLEEDESNDTTIINLPDSEVESGMEELNIDELPEDNHSTDKSFLLDNPNKCYDKQKVKELQLKAKLAVYRAQYQLNKYCEKYGDDLSDSGTDTDYELSDDDESEVEEVQL
jgi:hypothetical protein